MERDQAVFDNLLDRENKLVADILSGFRGLVLHGVAKAGDRSSTGQAAYNAMAVEILMNGMVKSTEDLLSLTRLLRELWVVGPLKKLGEGDDEAKTAIRDDADAIFGLLRRLRADMQGRMTAESGGATSYISGVVEGPPTQGQGQGQQRVQEGAAQT